MASIVKIKDKWRALIRRKGHASYCKTFATKAQAEAWARAIEADIDRGRAPQAAAVVGRTLTVADVVDAYVKLRESSNPVLDTSNEHYVIRRLRISLGDIDATRITPQDLAGYCAFRRDDGAGPYTCNMEMSKLGTILRYGAMALKVTLPDVVAQARPLLSHTKAIGGGGRRERRPTQDELDRIDAYMRAKHAPIYADVIKFAVATAMRRGEIVKLLWSDVDEARKMALIRDRKDPRQTAGNDQWIPLLLGAWDLVKDRPRDDVRVWPVHEQTMTKYFTRACKTLGIPDLHFHDLRHEGASRLFEAGYSIQEVALVTGHRSWNMLRRYTQLRPEDLHHGPRGK